MDGQRFCLINLIIIHGAGNKVETYIVIKVKRVKGLFRRVREYKYLRKKIDGNPSFERGSYINMGDEFPGPQILRIDFAAYHSEFESRHVYVINDPSFKTMEEFNNCVSYLKANGWTEIL